MNIARSLFFIFVLVIIEQCLSQFSCNSRVDLMSQYDFVIVGAGSSGSVVANRLSEMRNINVLLLEAGGEEDPILNEIPQMADNLLFTDKDWQFVTSKQNSAFIGDNPKYLIYPRGKVLGGSSSINYMIYMRGNRRDYDKWNEEVGGGWSYEDVLPFFKKSEDNRATNLNAFYHRKGGHLTVTGTTVVDSTTNLFLKAAKQIGLEEGDVNGRNQTGIMPTPYTIRDGARCSTNKAFLKSASNRPNLHILTNAYVKKVLLTRATDNKLKAEGVVFKCGKTERTVKASKEVILSAGTIKSPQLLMLSGIGPEEQLKKFGIAVKVNLPGVGENLHDHISLIGLSYIKEQSKKERVCIPNDYQSKLLEWSFNRTGPLTSPMPPPNLIGFVSSSKTNRELNWPEIQLIFSQPFSVPYLTPDDRTIASCFVAVMRTQSRGVVQLASDNPMEPPIIDPRYLSEESDLNDLIEGAKTCASFAETPAFKDAGIKFKMQNFTLCEKYNLSAEYLRCAIQEMISAGWHCVGTCKMGNDHDKLAVVDSQLRVFNVTGLRVVDASIMPQTPSGNTNAASIMVGERGADFIKKSLH